MSVCHFPGFLWDGKRWTGLLYIQPFREKGVNYRDINVCPASISILCSQKVKATHQPVGPQLLYNTEMQAASASRIQCSSYK